MTVVAITEKDKDGTWWVSSTVFPNLVQKCKSMGDADRLKDALNAAYEMGKEAKRQEIADAYAKFEDLLRPPLVDYYANEEAA
jgi:predicted RNase H-like HicB family nuclease